MAEPDNVPPVAPGGGADDAAAPEPAEPVPEVLPDLPSAEASEVAQQQQEASEEGWQVARPKRRGRPPGTKNKPKIVALPPAPVEEEPDEQPPEPPSGHRCERHPTQARHRRPADELPQSYEAPRLSHRDLSSILSEHLLQVESQKRLSQQEMYARLVRGVL